MKKDSDFTRRDFLRIAAGGAAAAWLAGRAGGGLENSLAAQENDVEVKSRIVRVSNPAVWKAENELDRGAVREMLRRGMIEFTGEGTERAAWGSLFSPDDVVGMKLNAAGGRGMSSNKELVLAIVAGLMSAGVKENNIIVWERFTPLLANSGFGVKKGRKGVRSYASELTMGRGGRGYDRGVYLEYPGGKSYVTKIITRDITALINVPVLKDHGSAGVTIALKNLAYGAIDNTERFHKTGNDPAIADACALPAIRKKLRLCVLDALRCLYDGGPMNRPRSRVNFGEIHIGADQVAIDTIGCKIIEAQRKKNGLPALKAVGREPKHIRTAEKRGLGTTDRKKMDIRKVKL